MDSTTRPASSVYSQDLFELEHVLRPLSAQNWQHEIETLEALQKEKDRLQHEVDCLHHKWISIHHVKEELVDTANQLVLFSNYARSRMDLERKKWVANCTAF